jgi:hypothetical protein
LILRRISANQNDTSFKVLPEAMLSEAEFDVVDASFWWVSCHKLMQFLPVMNLIALEKKLLRGMYERS